MSGGSNPSPPTNSHIMKKGYVIEYNVRCIKTGKRFPDNIIPSEMFGDTFTDIMNDSKIGDTSIVENIEGIYSEGAGIGNRMLSTLLLDTTVPVVYDQMFVVTN